MSLIHCPECNKEISDKVKACPFCGFPFSQDSDNKGDIQQVEISSVNISPKDPKKRRLILLSLITSVLIIAAIFITYFLLELKKYNTYVDNLNLLKVAMINGGSDSETLLNLTAKVWFNSIYNEDDPETDIYTKNNSGYFYDDFNIALSYFFNGTYSKSLIDNIKANQIIVDNIMKNMQKPPRGLENCYSTVTDLYSVYKSLTDLAINPSGSLQSFSDNKTEKIDRFLELYNRLETQIPMKKFQR